MKAWSRGSTIVVVLATVLATVPSTTFGRRSSGTSTMTFAPAPTKEPTPTPYVFTGCLPGTGLRARESGPWDARTYDNILPGSTTEDFCGNLEVCFAIDESGSMGSENFGKEISFVRKIIAKLVETVHPGFPTKFSAYLFDGNSADTDELSKRTTDYQYLLSRLSNAVYDGGCTNISAGLSNCYQQLKSSSDGKKVLFLLSDGWQSVDANLDAVYVEQDEDEHVQQLAAKIKADGITLITVELILSGYYEPSSLKDFLEILASRRMDGTSRSYSSRFESLDDDDLINSLLSGDDGLCDDEIIGPTPSAVPEVCTCAEVDLYDRGPVGDSIKVKADTIVGDRGRRTGTCEISTPFSSRYVCDLSNQPNAVCSVEERIQWVCDPGTKTGDQCACTEILTTKVLPYSRDREYE